MPRRDATRAGSPLRAAKDASRRHPTTPGPSQPVIPARPAVLPSRCARAIATRVTEEATLQPVAQSYRDKYSWPVTVIDDGFDAPTAGPRGCWLVRSACAAARRQARRLLSTNRVSAEIRSPSNVSTISPCAWNTGACASAGSSRRRAARWPGSEPAGPAWPSARRSLAEEGGDGRRALILQRDRRHGEPGVVGEQRDHAVDVIVGVRGGEAVARSPFPGRAGERRPLPVRPRQPARHRGPGPL